jgi:hypothetical protein
MHRLDSYIQANKVLQEKFVPNLKGMLIGNGLTSYRWDCIPAFLDMAPYHNLLDDNLHQRLSESCTWQDFMVKAPSPGHPSLGNATCDKYFDEWMTQIDKLNIYDIYGTCHQNRSSPTLYSMAQI